MPVPGSFTPATPASTTPRLFNPFAGAAQPRMPSSLAEQPTQTLANPGRSAVQSRQATASLFAGAPAPKKDNTIKRDISALAVKMHAAKRALSQEFNALKQ